MYEMIKEDDKKLNYLKIHYVRSNYSIGGKNPNDLRKESSFSRVKVPEVING